MREVHHGTTSTYGRLGCRCRPCTDAHAAGIARWRARHPARAYLIDVRSHRRTRGAA